MNFEKFDELEICGELLFGIQDMGFTAPTAVQAQVIPLFMERKDVLATAPTGTGKTCAFGIPMIEKIDKLLDKTQGLVVAPTRELAMQITEELKKLTKHIKEIRVVSIYGGENISKQLAHLRKRPQIVVGTPGRIMDHLRRRTLKLDMLTTLVLDEADEMLNMGFREDIEVIAKACPKYRQTVMFSATMPKEIQLISQAYQTNPENVTIERKDEDMPKIKQIGIRATSKTKEEKLLEVLFESNYTLAVIFCNTKRYADKIKAFLREKEYRCDALHSDIRQSVRTRIMKKFRSGEIDILVATDVAARGIDVGNVDMILNYDLPMDEEYYIHRIGRTGRAKKEGVAYSFYTKDEIVKMNKYAKATNGHIFLDPEDVIENIDDYSLRTGNLMQPRKRGKGGSGGGRNRNRGEMRGKEAEDMPVAEQKTEGENKNKRKDNKPSGRRNDDRRQGKAPQSNPRRAELFEASFVQDRFESYAEEYNEKPEKASREKSRNRGNSDSKKDFVGKDKKFGKKEFSRDNKKSDKKDFARDDRKSGRNDFARDDRKPRSEFAREDRKPRNSEGENFERREERAPRRPQKGTIDSFANSAPRRKSDEYTKKDMSFKPKQGKTNKNKSTSFNGKKAKGKTAGRNKF